MKTPRPMPRTECSRKGGIARAAKLSARRRRQIAKAAAAARWAKQVKNA